MELTPRETPLTVSVADSSSSSIVDFTFAPAEFESCLHFNIAQKTSKIIIISLLDRKSTVKTKGRRKKQKGAVSFCFWLARMLIRNKFI